MVRGHSLLCLMAVTPYQCPYALPDSIYDDLFSAGFLGLLNAAREFNVDVCQISFIWFGGRVPLRVRLLSNRLTSLWRIGLFKLRVIQTLEPVTQALRLLFSSFPVK